MASWLGHATISWTNSEKTISLPLKTTADASSTANSQSLLSLCQEVTPPCHLNPLLPSGDAQTIMAALKKKGVPSDDLHYKRKQFISNSTLYPGTFAVDFVSRQPAGVDEKTVNPRTTLFEGSEWERYVRTGCIDVEDEALPAAQERPILVALHGISGGSHELYVRETLNPLINGTSVVPGGEKCRLWDCMVINARGCANSPVTSDRLFNARATWDVKQLVDWLHATFPQRRIFGIGFSLGANILINYLGEEGDSTPMCAAVPCSNPWNLEVGNLHLQRTWKGREIYSKNLAVGMQKLFEKHIDSIKKNPDVDIEKVRGSKYLHVFDRYLQGPTWGYPSEGAYYRDASSVEPLLAVRVPVFAIHADDDPVAPREVCPFEETKQNPYVVLCTTDMGGHLSWFEVGGTRWFIKPAVNFLRAVADKVDFDALKKSGSMENLNGHAGRSSNNAPIYNPVRRKLHVPE